MSLPATLDDAGPLVVVGGGEMGSALLRGWLAAGLDPDAVTLIEPDRARRDHVSEWARVRAFPDAQAMPAGDPPRVALLAVKPQMMAKAVPPLQPRLGPATMALSIAAGTTLAQIEGWTGGRRPVVRAMPNTPAAVLRGATVLCANAATGAAERDLATRLMSAAGIVRWVGDEELMHAVTALSGSGPAYVFLLIEAMAAAGRQLGLPTDLARDLARATVTGAGELAHRSTTEAGELRKAVTSPGGTTAAALMVLQEPGAGLEPLIARALAAAAERSRALAREGADGGR